MIDDYTENQLKILLYTFLNTACDEEIATAYDVFIGIPIGDHPEEEDSNVIDNGDDDGYVFTVKYNDAEMFLIRQRLSQLIDKDFKGEMTIITDLVDWISGLGYIGTEFKDDKFIYKFDDGVDELIID